MVHLIENFYKTVDAEKRKSGIRIKKAKINLILFLCLVISVGNIIAQDCDQQGTEGTIEWCLKADTLTISGTGQMPPYTNGGAPWYPYRDDITTVVIENGVTSIGQHAFVGFSVLNSVEIPTSVLTIGNYAFGGCKDLVSLEMPEVTAIGNNTFRGCTSLESVEMPEVTTIGNDTFVGCTSLESVEMPNVETIGNSAFASSGLVSVEIPNVTTIEEYTFADCKALVSVEMPNVITIKDFAFWLSDALVSLDLPNATTIRYNAFDCCAALVTVDIPNVTTIGSDTFRACSSLTTVNMPNVETIGTAAFRNCNELVSVTMTSVKHIYDRAFLNCSKLISADLPNVINIWEGAFSNCYSLKTVTLSSNIEFMDYCSFASCISLQNIYCNKPTSPFVVEYYSPFVGVTKSNCFLHVPAGFESKYRNHEVWKDFLIVGDIKNDCLSPIASGSVGTLDWEICSDGTLMINGIGDMIDFESGNEPWYPYKDEITDIIIGYGVTRVGNFAFSNYNNLISVVLSSVTSFGNYSFEGCDNLVSVNIPSITYIEEGAFKGCTSIVSLKLPKVTAIGYQAFKDCTSLATIEMSNVLTIGEEAFQDCNLLFHIEMQSVETIGNSAFSGCETLFFADLPNIITIADNAFENCTSLIFLSLSNQLMSVGIRAFGSCSSLENIFCYSLNPPDAISDLYLGTFEGVPVTTCVLHVLDGTVDLYSVAEGWKDFSNIVVYTEIEECTSPIANGTAGSLKWRICTEDNGDRTFTISGIGKMPDYSHDYSFYYYDRPPWYDYGQTNNNFVNKIVIDYGVLSIGNIAFSFFKEVVSVDIPNSVATIGNDSFRGLMALTSITLPSYLQSLGTLALGGCGNLEHIYSPNPIPPAAYNNSTFLAVPVNTCILHVPEGSEYDYSIADGWKEFTTIVALSEVGIYNTKSEKNSIEIYPNPAVDELRIINYELGIEKIEIFDVTGRLVHKVVQTEINYNKVFHNEMIIDISKLSGGVYFLKIGNERVKFVKQ
ncbi:MAG: leucine-rich repeat protein [Marinilabiliaceae bacterium]|nr:leucine-rich repeat protein [Marinilabiliaceae bacterium]